MKNIIKTFKEKDIRCFLINKEPYFSVLDVCEMIGLTNSREQTSRLDKDDVRTTYAIDKLGRKQKLTIINEGALYQLVFKSKKKEANDFKRWVTHEVLPSIRKTGKYSIPEKVKQISTDKRNVMTDAWKEHGIEKPHEYINLTLQEYKSLGFEKGIRKPNMTKEQLLMLSALESMESLKLFYNPEIEGYYDCKKSLNETSKSVAEQIK